MANRKPLIVAGGELQSIKLGDVLVDANGTPYSTGGGGGDVLPITQIAYGTGTGISSSTDLAYDVTSGAFTLTPSPKETPGNFSILGTPSQEFILPATVGGLVVIFNTPSFAAFFRFTLGLPLVNGTEPTGLTPSTTYTADIATNDSLNGPQLYHVSVLGSNALDFNSLITELNNQIFISANAIVDNFVFPPLFTNSGALELFTNINGATASVTYVDTGPNPLFGSLAAPYQVVSTTATPGTDGQSIFFLTDPTGFSNDATLYSETFEVDGGGPIVVSFPGSAAQTLGDLFTQIATQLSTTYTFDGFSSFTINSPTSGSTSTISTDATGFFSNPFVYPPTFITGFYFTSQFFGTDPTPSENAPGSIQIVGGNGDQNASGSDVTVTAGAGGVVNGFGGSLFFTGGFSSTAGGGSIFLRTGQGADVNDQRSSITMSSGTPIANGGNIAMLTGSAGAGSGANGGVFTLLTGNGDAPGQGGSIALATGSSLGDNGPGFIELLAGTNNGGSTIVVGAQFGGYPVSHPIQRGKDIIIAPTNQQNLDGSSGRVVTHTNNYMFESPFTRIFTIGGSTGIFGNGDGNEISTDADCGSVIFEGHFIGHQGGSPPQFQLGIIIKGAYNNNGMMRVEKTYFGDMVDILSADATPTAQKIIVDGDQTALFNSFSLGAAWVGFTGTANDTQVAGGGPGVYNTKAVTYDLTTNKTTINIEDGGPFPSPLAVSQGNLGRVGINSSIYYSIDVSLNMANPSDIKLRFTSIFSEVPNPDWIGRVVLTYLPAGCGT